MDIKKNQVKKLISYSGTSLLKFPGRNSIPEFWPITLLVYFSKFRQLLKQNMMDPCKYGLQSLIIIVRFKQIFEFFCKLRSHQAKTLKTSCLYKGKEIIIYRPDRLEKLPLVFRETSISRHYVGKIDGSLKPLNTIVL